MCGCVDVSVWVWVWVFGGMCRWVWVGMGVKREPYDERVEIFIFNLQNDLS